MCLSYQQSSLIPQCTVQCLFVLLVAGWELRLIANVLHCGRGTITLLLIDWGRGETHIQHLKSNLH